MPEKIQHLVIYNNIILYTIDMPKTRKIALKKSKTRKHGNKRGGNGHSGPSLALSRRTIKTYSNFQRKSDDTKHADESDHVEDGYGDDFDKLYSVQENIKTQKNPEFKASNIEEKYNAELESYKKYLNEYHRITSGNKSCSLISKVNLRADCIKLTNKIKKLHAKFENLHKEYPELRIPDLPANIGTNVYQSKAKSQKATPYKPLTY
jgi:hypothetical protein